MIQLCYLLQSCVQSGDVYVHAPYMEKFMAHPHKPTLVDHGQCAMNGFFAISASGTVLACAET